MVRLKVSDCFDDIFVPVAGKWWACQGTSPTKVNICMRGTPGRCPGGECKSVRMGSTVDFSGGYKVRATGRGETGLGTYADVKITPPAYAPALPAVVGTIPIEILIPNKVSGHKIYTFNVDIIAAVPKVEVEIPEVRPVCTVGEEQTVRCADGTIIVTHVCEKDPITGINFWNPTGRPCPVPEVRPVCTEGEEQTVRCADGTIIATHVCGKDPITGINFWNPTGRSCPAPELGKVAKIMVPPDGELRAFEGMDVTITASVMCGASPSNGELAILIIDGKEVARKNTSAGFVSFKWTATTEPARTHRVVVSVPKSDQCPMHGEARDSKPITVSRIIPGIQEQLRIEREAYQSQLATMREERKRIREMSLAARAAVTPITIPVTPPIELPITIPVTPPVEPPITPPVEPPVEPQPGIIDIPSIITPPTEYPIEIFIDGVLKGSPPLEVEVDPGTYHITVKLTNFTPLDRKVTITEGQTLTITNMEFLL